MHIIGLGNNETTCQVINNDDNKGCRNASLLQTKAPWVPYLRAKSLNVSSRKCAEREREREKESSHCDSQVYMHTYIHKHTVHVNLDIGITQEERCLAVKCNIKGRLLLTNLLYSSSAFTDLTAVYLRDNISKLKVERLIPA